jgi:hypothetical protein
MLVATGQKKVQLRKLPPDPRSGDLRQKDIDEVGAGGWFGLGIPVTLELGPDAAKRKKRPVLVQSEPDQILLVSGFGSAVLRNYYLSQL